MNMEILSKARLKFIQTLQHKKFRQKYDKFIVEGLKINSELLRERKEIVEHIYISNPEYQSILQNSASAEKLSVISPQQMQVISQMTTPPGVLSVCQLPGTQYLPVDITGMSIFYLDAIRDPGNMGTIFRIADWFGFDYVICSPDCVDIFNHKVLQASMGSVLRVHACEMERQELISRGMENVFICDPEGKSIYEIQPPGEGIIILGNESLGVSDDIMAKVKETIAIPADRSLGAESLNVASAAAVIAAWWSYERGRK